MPPAITGDKRGMWSAMRDGVLDLVLPPRCPACSGVVAAPDRFCVDCWTALRFIGPPWCAGCNLPLEHDVGGVVRCDECIAAPPRHAGVRAAVGYGAVSRMLALKLKYGGRSGLATTAAKLMRRHLPDDATLIVPVPLHRWRMWSRGYNQAALIAQALARLSGVPDDRVALERHRATRSLRGVARADRRHVLAGAFRAAPARVAGHRIVLVDDVYTSGATADACIDALLGAGARSVTILAWARVLGEGDPD